MDEELREESRISVSDLALLDPEVLSESTDPRFAFRYVDIAAVSTGHIDLPDVVMTFRDAPSRARMVIRTGDIVMSTVRPGLKAFARFVGDTESVVASTGFAVLRAKEECADSVFLLNALLSDDVSAQINKAAVGSNYPAINGRDVRRLTVPELSLKSQQRIAAILTSLDNAIEATEALIAKHQQIKAGVMQDLLTRGVLLNGALRPTPLESPDLYCDSPLGKVPAGWVVAGLVSRQRPGANWIRTGPFGSSLKGEHWVAQGHPVITIGALGEGEFLSSELLHVGPRDASRLRDFQLRDGDVVFSRVADVGRSVVVRRENAGWIMSSNLMRIAVDPDLVRPDFLQMALASDVRIKAQIRSNVNSGGREVANSQVLSQLLFAWPRPDEQDRIVSLGQLASSRIRSLQSAVQKCRALKLGLMQDLLTGKVRVPLAEPALA